MFLVKSIGMVSQNVFAKSNAIMYENMDWLLNSDIRIKSGPNRGALYGWMNLKPKSFPFIYSEITGYAISCFCWMSSEFENKVALDAAKEASQWIRKNMQSSLLIARPPVNRTLQNELSSMFYSFDNSMIIIGLLNLYKIVKSPGVLKLADVMTRALVDRFFDGEKLIPRVNTSFESIVPEDTGIVKWSTVPGAYHCKVSLGLLELSELTGNKEYARVSDLLCDYAKKMQNNGGEFITNPGSEIIYLHPHLYACEGLIYSGIKQSNGSHYAAGLKGIKWAMDIMDSKADGGLFRDTGKASQEQSDCTAQLLRLLILCRSDLEKVVKSKLFEVIDTLHLRLLEFYISAGEGRGAMKYQFSKDTACSWCTMFSVQALKLWSFKRSRKFQWMDYFV